MLIKGAGNGGKQPCFIIRKSVMEAVKRQLEAVEHVASQNPYCVGDFNLNSQDALVIAPPAPAKAKANNAPAKAKAKVKAVANVNVK